jgi:hypothetical protein
MEEFSRERLAIAERAQSQVADAAAEADALRRLVRVKAKELGHVRRLAQEVLAQRSDVEIFLLSSLQTVREQMGSQPLSLGREPSAGALALSGAAGVDVALLSWGEREQVLRLLFAKVHGASKVATQLPQHTFEGQLGRRGGAATDANSSAAAESDFGGSTFLTS